MEVSREGQRLEARQATASMMGSPPLQSVLDEQARAELIARAEETVKAHMAQCVSPLTTDQGLNELEDMILRMTGHMVSLTVTGG